MDTTEASIPNQQFTVNSERQVGASANGALVNSAKGVLKDKRVRSVDIGYSQLFEAVVTQLGVTNQLATAPAICTRLLSQPNTFLISRVVGSRGITYKFTTNGNRSLTLDLSILKLLAIDGLNADSLVGQAELDVKEPRLLGYQLWTPILGAGLGKNLVLVDFPADSIRARKGKE